MITRSYSICAALALILGLPAVAAPGAAMAWPLEVRPFAYVANNNDNSVSVIDTGNNRVVDKMPVGSGPFGVAVAPDGKFVYVANFASATISVIDTSNQADKVVATIPVGSGRAYVQDVAVTPNGKYLYVTDPPENLVAVIDAVANRVVATISVGLTCQGVAVTPDGKYVYVTNTSSGTVSVIATASNKVTATVPVGTYPQAVTVTPDGKFAYVANRVSNNLSVIATVNNTVTATVPVGNNPGGIVVTPDGKFVYLTTGNIPSAVSVIATADNTMAHAPIPVGNSAYGIAVTPDGKSVYVVNNSFDYDTVRVIDTTINAVKAIVHVGRNPVGVAFVPAPPGLPFREYRIAYLDIAFGAQPNQDIFNYYSYVTLGSTASNGIRPDAEPLTLQIGTNSVTIPAGSFKKQADGSFVFIGKYQGVQFDAYIRPAGTLRYLVHVLAIGVNLAGTANPVQARLIIGDDAGLAAAKATLHQTVSIQASKQ